MLDKTIRNCGIPSLITYKMTSQKYLRTSLLAWREDQVGKVLSLQMLVPEVNSQILIKFSGTFVT